MSAKSFNFPLYIYSPLSVLTSTNPDDLEDIFQDIVYLEFSILRILAVCDIRFPAEAREEKTVPATKFQFGPLSPSH